MSTSHEKFTAHFLLLTYDRKRLRVYALVCIITWHCKLCTNVHICRYTRPFVHGQNRSTSLSFGKVYSCNLFSLKRKIRKTHPALAGPSFQVLGALNFLHEVPRNDMRTSVRDLSPPFSETFVKVAPSCSFFRIVFLVSCTLQNGFQYNVCLERMTHFSMVLLSCLLLLRLDRRWTILKLRGCT